MFSAKAGFFANIAFKIWTALLESSSSCSSEVACNVDALWGPCGKSIYSLAAAALWPYVQRTIALCGMRISKLEMLLFSTTRRVLSFVYERLVADDIRLEQWKSQQTRWIDWKCSNDIKSK